MRKPTLFDLLQIILNPFNNFVYRFVITDAADFVIALVDFNEIAVTKENNVASVGYNGRSILGEELLAVTEPKYKRTTQSSTYERIRFIRTNSQNTISSNSVLECYLN